MTDPARADAPWIIGAKFEQPTPLARQVHRTPLVDRLRAADPAFIVVQAPAGFGKSTLLAQWARDVAGRGTAVAWLSLDEDDRSAEQFVVYLAAALRGALGMAAPASGSPSSYADMPPRAVLTALLGEIGRAGRRIAVVLDDYHRAEGAEVDALVRGFLERAAPLVRIAIASRSLPRLELSRWKAAGRLCLLGDRDLRFDEAETARFLARGRSPGRDGWARFAERAEGWPVALQFARLWLEDGGDPAALTAASEVSDLGAYLSEQVVASLSPDQRAFLLRMSPLETVSADLAEAVGLPDAEAIVGALARSALPITLLSQNPVRFRCHHLLGDFLLARAAREGVDLPAIHRRAARWFADHGDLGSAVRHALVGGDAPYAAALLEDAGGWRLIYSGQGHLRVILRSVHGALGGRDGFPRLRLAASVLAAKRGDLATASTLFAEVAGRRDAAGPVLDGEIDIIDALIRLYCDEPPGETLLAALVALTGRLRDRDPIGLALSTNLVAFFTLQRGDYGGARSFGERAIRHFRQAGAAFGELHLYAHVGAAQLAAGNRTAAALTYATMRELCRRTLGRGSDLEAIADVLEAETAYEADDRRRARQLLVPALDQIEAADGWFDVFAAGYVTAARLEAADHGPAAAFAALDRGRRTAAARGMGRLGRLLEEETLRIAVLCGDLDRARAGCRPLAIPLGGAEAAQSPRPVSALRGEGSALVAARLLVASGRPDEAVAFLDVAAAQMRDRGAPLTRRVTAHAVRALAEHALGRPACAALALAEAVDLASRDRFARTLLDEGASCRSLLRSLGEAADTGLRRRLGQLLDREPRAEAEPDPGLSIRERQILVLLAEGQSNKEIARSIALDPNTVKYHLKRLFAKLAVERRTHAVIRARQSGLIA